MAIFSHMSAAKTIMILDHDTINSFITEGILRAAGFNGSITVFTDIDTAIQQLTDTVPDFLFMDFFQSEQDKFSILYAVEEMPGKKPVVIVLWDFSLPHVQQLSVLFPFVARYYHKPFKLEEALLFFYELNELQA